MRKDRAQEDRVHRSFALTAPFTAGVMDLSQGVRVAAQTRPSARTKTSGDWWDALTLPDGSLGLVIGDVMGHDAVATVAMMQLANITRAYVYECHPPTKVLDLTDQIMQDQEIAPLATVICARLIADRRGALMHYANAGHPPPLLRHPDGTVKVLAATSSLLLGVPLAHVHPRDESMAAMSYGSMLLLYTDGLIERRHTSFDEGLERLITAFGALDCDLGPKEASAQLLTKLLEEDPEDDVTVVVVRVAQPTSTAS